SFNTISARETKEPDQKNPKNWQKTNSQTPPHTTQSSIQNKNLFTTIQKNGIKQSTNTLSSSQRTHTHPNYSQRKQPR
ncbi:hypothetical protein, partial [Gordonia sp. NPDC003950]